MAYLSTYAANLVLNALFNGGTISGIGAWYLALFTTNPTQAGSGTEVTGGSYARELIGFGSASSASISSDIAASFTGMPTCTVTHWAVFDAVTSGNLLAAGAFSSPYVLNAGDELNLPSGDIDLSFPGA